MLSLNGKFAQWQWWHLFIKKKRWIWIEERTLGESLLFLSELGDRHGLWAWMRGKAFCRMSVGNFSLLINQSNVHDISKP